MSRLPFQQNNIVNKSHDFFFFLRLLFDSFCLFRGEKNFHIFYYLYDGLSSEGRLNEYFLHKHPDCRNHRYLRNSKDPKTSSGNSINVFNKIISSFKLLGFDSGVSSLIRGNQSLTVSCNFRTLMSSLASLLRFCIWETWTLNQQKPSIIQTRVILGTLL